MNPELLSYVSELILEHGAKDVFITPVIMKKGRPGSLLSILAPETIVQAIEKILFEETSTIGLRKYQVRRTVLPRGSKKIETKFGEIEVKYTIINGIEHMHPEYEICKTLARKHQLPLQEIYREIERIFPDHNERKP